MTTLTASLNTLNRKYTEATMRFAYILSLAFLIISVAALPDVLISVFALCGGVASSIFAILTNHEILTRDFDRG